jgi:hypothetical protein
MKTKDNNKPGTKWLTLGMVLATSFLLAANSQATADTPTKTPFSFIADLVMTDVLPFPVNIHSIISGTQTVFVDDETGLITRIFIHQNEQDTFSANGKTLEGLPFTFNVEVDFDSSGNLTHIWTDGIVEKIPLPDGTLFIGAGRFDQLAHPGATFFITADKGNPGKIAALTAALSP